ncbi:helix-turn-helix transcriptional regulator [Candidatus Micrarchaeota archaeon]|nr:helix-turn-helix transcriptional regulator [Candidatus Micrarchaeota archaeon]
MDFSTQFRRAALYLVAGTRGGPMRLRVMRLILHRPSNAHQVSIALGVDYTTAVHHLEKLLKARWISRDAKRYGELYFSALSPEQVRVLDEFVPPNPLNPG